MKSIAIVALLLFAISVAAQDAAKAPELPFHVVENFFKLPKGMILAEAVGVAVNSKGEIFTLNRGNHPLMEFTSEGAFVASYGEDSPVFHVPHSIRFDSQDNLWFVNAADNLVVKLDPNLQVAQALGRREEPWVYLTHGIERSIPLPENFYQPTDAAVAPDGSTFVTDGYGNSRVVKFTHEGNLVKYWGDRGAKPGQFNTPHSIVIDSKSNLYVADRQNNRVQVFDSDGNFKQQFVLDGPAWSLCMTPGANPVIFVGSVGRVYKLDLNGKVLGRFGKFGKLPGWFDWIHSVACPDEKTLFLAEELSYRFDKVVLQ